MILSILKKRYFIYSSPPTFSKIAKPATKIPPIINAKNFWNLYLVTANSSTITSEAAT